MPKISAIIPSYGDNKQTGVLSFLHSLNDPDLEIIKCEGKSRPHSLNSGAQKATSPFLWFIHADTTLDKRHVHALKKSLEENPHCLHYFDLNFDTTDGGKLTKLNAWGANYRSRILGIPWGDQALCLSSTIFQQLGKYPEDASYGEDHLLVWHAHQALVPLRRIPLSVTTSAKKYKGSKWLPLTVHRQYKWIKQAIPEFAKLVAIRGKRIFK